MDGLKYIPETGEFRWGDGKVAGHVRFNGYVRVRYEGKLVYAHRLAWYIVNGTWPRMIDHIDGNPSNNRISNLREATYTENAMNRGVKRNNKSGFLG